MQTDDHTLTRMERGRYVYFTCPAQPKMEIVSFDLPLTCPVCRALRPVRLGTDEQRETVPAEYSPKFGADIEKF